ncbi:hypothetical membrane protein, conserved, containing DUF835 domain [Thermococcus kodakarensis KOD1]|uniref:Hypothetical membrane protein, conserved, containing DUF835 domain n=1 Tax=Thermococcus kodakarensis (strain ATCC BAA-918 / JCM 12380 / KOD1) TaxID=69014 RepID=Q5JGF7_THEKO|nr:DUF835 domain-containing protein [Thermococcus kodakarensis]WCN29126.1 DUF835 domain-containing protein [Thermococcus kodakarensis]WCN31429.1 DUF835 domain-containing protein [Thermococcus kodakarensis]BAD85376.1 hypothetical membrane protein, conserved, containing DUF835 domain [Thermococcus kodakarensis KOD1]
MNALYDLIIPILNFISRWALFIASTYQAKKTREKGWVLLSAAFLIDALDMESYVLDPLGITFKENAYLVASVVSTFAVAILFLWGALHIKYGKTDFKDVAYVAIFVVVSYIWIFLVASDIKLFENLTVAYSLPYLIFGLSMIYFGYVLLEATMPKSIERLFPYGLILLGALNLTYPVTRFIDWFAPIGFLLGALFRFMAAVGAVKYVFYPMRAVSVSGASEPIKGSFMFKGKEEVVQAIGDVWSRPGTVIITRENIMDVMSKIHPGSLVFWVTRAKEGVISETPQVYAVSPTSIDILTDLVANALRKGYRTVYIDSVEYLIIENGFERTMKFLLNLKDMTLNANGLMILVINEETLDEKQKGMIEREFETFRQGQASR